MLHVAYVLNWISLQISVVYGTQIEHLTNDIHEHGENSMVVSNKFVLSETEFMALLLRLHTDASLQRKIL